MEELMEAEILGVAARLLERVEDCTNRVEQSTNDDGK
jgi:hypothetical protein